MKTPQQFILDRQNAIAGTNWDIKKFVKELDEFPMGLDEVASDMKAYAKEAVQYALQVAAEKAQTKWEPDVRVKKESILSLETQILKDLGI